MTVRADDGAASAPRCRRASRVAAAGSMGGLLAPVAEFDGGPRTRIHWLSIDNRHHRSAMHVGFAIRSAVPADAEEIAALYRQLLGSAAVTVLPERIAQIARDENTALFVAERAGGLCATALVSLCADVMYGFQPYAVIENFVVEESVRSSGIGTALMHRVEEFCLGADCSKIMLLSGVDRAAAHGFFERVGFSGTSKRAFVKYRREMRSMSPGTV